MNQTRDQIVMEEFQNIILSNVVHLNEELEHGAFGSIYKVKCNGETCFAKDTNLFLADGDSKYEKAQKTIESFLRECQRYSKLTPHPNLVNLFGIYFLKSCEVARMQLPVMVMEATAGTLTSFVNSQDISINTKFAIIIDVAFGLYYLHSQTPPIVHCDLSPNSILMTDQGVAAIGDFGTYKIIRAGGNCAMSQGDPDFMAPEANIGADPGSHCSVDVFAFAGIALYTFTQQWPKPSDPFKDDCDFETSSMLPLSEVQRRMKYLNLMTEESTTVLKSIIKECLDMDPTRRPSMVDIHEEIVNIEATLPKNMQMIKQSKQIPDLITEFPLSWEVMPKDSSGKEFVCHVVDLQPSDPEYQEVQTAFTSTMPPAGSSGDNLWNDLIKIQRIQNPTLYAQYAVRKKIMEKENPKIENEKQLFHGNRGSNVENIYHQGFNGIFEDHSMAYGDGIYFRVNASRAARITYSPPDANGNRFMFYARVLTGEFTQGQSRLRLPPPKDPSISSVILYNSVVDNVNAPNTHVVFIAAQCYPDYLITFT